jgi:phasin
MPDPVVQQTQKVARQFAERGATVAEETTKDMEQVYASASKGAADFSAKLLDMAQANMNAAFEFSRKLSRVQSPSEFIELSTAHASKQWEVLTDQTRQLTAMVQKATTEAAQPLQAGISKTFNQTLSKSS